jgi:hypothetical protein
MSGSLFSFWIVVAAIVCIIGGMVLIFIGVLMIAQARGLL